MKSKLERFVQENKDDFDAIEPSGTMWNRIEKGMDNSKGNIVPMRKWLSVAAAIIIVAGVALLYFRHRSTAVDPAMEVASTGTDPLTPGTAVPYNSTATNDPVTNDSQARHSAASQAPALAGDDALSSIAHEEMTHYTRLVELKQQQVSILKKDEPLLYKQFSHDFEKIDSTFALLKAASAAHPGNEQVLEAMIQNLRLQSALLNRQLEIIKNINNKKQQRYEKIYNNI